MQLRLAVCDRRTGRQADLFVEVPAGTCLGRVLPQLRLAVDAEPAGSPGQGPTAGAMVSVAGRRVSPAAELGAPPLLHGAVVVFDESAAAPSLAVRPLLELHVVAGPDAGAVVPLRTGRHVIGRAPGCAVRIEDDDVSRAHCELVIGAAGASARDLGSTNGTALDGVPVGAASTALSPGAVLRVGRTSLVLVVPDGAPLVRTPENNGRLALNRPPRVLPSVVPVVHDVPSPPAARERSRLPWLPVGISLALAGVLLLATGGRSTFLLLLLLSPVLLLATALGDRRNHTVSERARRSAYETERAAALDAIAEACVREAIDRGEQHPDLARLTAVACGPLDGLWERRPYDPDFAVLRIGLGTMPARLVVNGDVDAPVVSQVPVPLALPDVGVVGMAGPYAATRSLAAALLVQLAVLHSPRELQLAIVSADQDPYWDWTTLLPHHVAVTPTTERSDDATQPALVVLLDGAGALRRHAGTARLLAQKPGTGVYVICLDAEVNALPAECRAVAELAADGRTLRLRVSGAAEVEAVEPDQLNRGRAETVARALAPLVDATPSTGGAALPDEVRLLDVHHISGTGAGGAALAGAAVAESWRLAPRSTGCLLGMTPIGPFSIDLRRDGPHTLIAGTTGSGKSELLQTLVASLALVNRPDELVFVLVDYKGGAAFDRCGQLPHTVGLVTDLDAHLTRRALASLSAELRRRERLLREAGVADLDRYVAAREGMPELPRVPRLVIVVDEFAALVEELPDFVPGLVAIAQRGRSLGVHLVLATQRPGGAVSADIRANTALRIALRVSDAGESVDIVGVRDAAFLPRSAAGRAVARSGSEPATLFQCVRVTAPPRLGRQPGVTVRHWRASAEEPPPADVGVPPADVGVETGAAAQQTDLHHIVSATTEAATLLGATAPPSPWLQPLPDSLLLDALPSDGVGLVRLGLRDQPDRQQQPPFVVDLLAGRHLLVAGGPRSGRTTTLRTAAVSAAGTHAADDLHMYALDGAAGALAPLISLPHCGSVVPALEPGRMSRLVEKLSAEVQRRHTVLSQQGMSSVAEQRSTGAVGDPLPLLLLLIDGWDAVSAALDGAGTGDGVEALLRLLRDGCAAGLTAVVTGGRTCLTGRVGALFADRLVLRLTDRTDFALAGVPIKDVPDRLPPGRGVLAESLREVQVALLDPDPSGRAQVGALRRVAARSAAPGRFPPWSVQALPRRVATEAVDWAGDETARALVAAHVGVRLGVGGDEASPVVLDLAAGPGAFLVAGPPGSGRSTALVTIMLSVRDSGPAVVAVGPPGSVLARSAGRAGVQCLAPDQVTAAALGFPAGRLVVLVDDVESLADSAAEAALGQVWRGAPGAVLVVAGDTAAMATAYRGLAADVRRHGRGLVLNPGSVLDDQILGRRLPRPDLLVPGRGVLVLGRECVEVQVAVPDERPAVPSSRSGTTGGSAGARASAHDRATGAP